MKPIFTKLLTFGTVLIMLASCKKDETKVVAQTGKPGNLQASSTTIVLSKAHIADTAVTFTWASTNYGYNAATTYVLQIDIKGDNFASPKEYTIAAGQRKQSFTVPDFNALLLAMNLPTGSSSQVEARIKSQISSNVPAVYSSTLDLNVTPFALIAYVYVPGAYQSTNGSDQWQPKTADSLVSPTGNGVYKGYVYFTAGSEFKITPAKNWDSSYGDAGGGKISLTSTGNLKAPGKGLYLVTVDTNAGTIAFASYDHLWSIIGDAANGWNSGDDIDMNFIQNSNVYQTTVNFKSSGGFKFRADHDWSLSYGDVSPVTGLLTSNNGANITAPATAGNYVVTLSFGDPLANPTYKLVKQ